MTRVLRRESDEPEVAGLLALMLLHHARRAARTDAAGAFVPLDEQDRSRWDARDDRRGRRGAAGGAGSRSGAASTSCRPRSPRCTTTPRRPPRPTGRRSCEWYDELVALTGNPLARLSRAVAVGEVDGPLAGLRATIGLDADLPGHHRLIAVRAYLHERAGQHDTAARALPAGGEPAPAAPSSATTSPAAPPAPGRRRLELTSTGCTNAPTDEGGGVRDVQSDQDDGIRRTRRRAPSARCRWPRRPGGGR